MRKTNRQRVLDYILEHKSITNQESVDNIRPRVFALSQEISRLEEDGWIFEHKIETGNGTKWARYVLLGYNSPRETSSVPPKLIPGTTQWRCDKGHDFVEYGDSRSGRCPHCNYRLFGKIVASLA